MIGLSTKIVGLSKIVDTLTAWADYHGHNEVRLEEATNLLYRFTREKFDTLGAGDWAPLAESTIIRKESQGFPDPERPLFASGDLYESATSPYGPYSVLLIEEGRALVQVDWDKDGIQIPTLHSQGAENLPQRRIWPSMDEPIGDALALAIRELLMGRVQGYSGGV